MRNLFRSEATAHAVRRLDGEVVLAMPLPFTVVVGFFAAVVLGAVLFACLATYARKETVPGWLAPTSGLIRVVARQGGVVDQLHVDENAEVAAGRPLMSLRLSADGAEGDVSAALDRGLDLEAQATEARSAAALTRLEAERFQTRTRIDALSRELRESGDRIALGEGRLRLAEAEVARAEAIAAKGFLPAREVDARRSAALAAATEVSQGRSLQLQLQREIRDSQARLSTLDADLLASRAETAASNASLAQRRTETDARGSYVVTAPVAGRLAALPVNRGQTVAPGAAVAVLTPQGSVLEAELYVPSAAAGFIRVGQEVRLQYQAYPHQKFGTGGGRIVSVSRSVLAPAEVPIPGIELREPVFRVRVRLDRDSVQAYGEALPLRPGMLLSADIVVDRRTLVEWLLDPLYAAGRRA